MPDGPARTRMPARSMLKRQAKGGGRGGMAQAADMRPTRRTDSLQDAVNDY